MIQSLIRAINVLEALKEPEKSFSLAELSEALELPPSTIHRILQTFCSKNYVTRDERTHLYQLGPALISLGMAATHHVKLQNAAPPILRKLSAMTGEDTFLVILAGFKGLVLEKVEGPNNLKVIEKFGYEVDLHCGAIRKSLLAYQPDSFIRDFIEHGLSRHADNTITNPSTLMEDLKKIRREGIAVSCGEYIRDAMGVGAPVFSRNGSVVASMGLIAPISRVDSKRIELLKRDVKQCSQELSYDLGYAENTADRYGKF
ncbi:HTH-type transcriptional repressor AllR [Caprobacter fermentans]|uniref:Glycerol operon regulatory protein n=1 Tax=Caproicibacter fermentans TaxID=2576756 RepID=A0A6N8I335_9FIRM|nr:IclR family transcriptional regulator [Caproicibacter fermentans]MVB12358.1 HTH-type transcriptional repressor AllR [Caproicibacter fermentans]OCN03074.1 transcriptional regulator [Clostridium sp. W14A]QNK40593.1 IclR family transcriptional regulator [Caproicibacter fermentans]